MIAIGVDLGKSRDPSAIAILEMAKPTFTLSGVRQPEIVDCVHLEKLPLGMSYPEVCARIEKLANVTFFLDPEVVVDATGVGRPVVDDLRARGVRKVVAVTSTGGNAETRHKIGPNRSEEWSVSKSLLWGSLSQLVYANRLRVSSSLEHAASLLNELGSLESRVSDAGRETFTVNSTDHHADLCAATSLAAWRLQLPKPQAKIINLPRKVL